MCKSIRSLQALCEKTAQASGGGDGEGGVVILQREIRTIPG